MISVDGTRVLERNYEETCKLLLEALKTPDKVEIVSTGSAYSLIVRVSLRDGLFRDDLVGEDDALMHRDERGLPTTGKPIREVILKFVLVSSPISRYEYDSGKPHKSTMLVKDVIDEYKQQRDAFDATKLHVPLCPDVVALISFSTQAEFDKIFFTKPTRNKHYASCRVFNKLRTYFSMQCKPQVAMIVMESIPETYVPLKTIFKTTGISPELIAQICAMYVVLFHTCPMIALDAHRSNWLVDMAKPMPLRVKLIDFGICLNPFEDVVINKIVDTYFKTHPTELPAYLTLMGANPDDSPSVVMNEAIKSATVPDAPMNSWIHKILVISMLIDGFFAINHSPKHDPSKPVHIKSIKKTCQMKHVFNAVYNDACESMSNILHTMRLDLPTYLGSQPPETAGRINEMLSHMASYMATYYGLEARQSMDPGMKMDPGMDLGMDLGIGALPRYGGKKMRKRTSSKKKRSRRKSIKSRKNKMHRK